MNLCHNYNINKHKEICKQRLYISLCTQMKTILTGLTMYAYWSGHVFVYVGGLRCVRMRACVCVVCVCPWCVCVVCVCVVCMCAVCLFVVCMCVCGVYVRSVYV